MDQPTAADGVPARRFSTDMFAPQERISGWREVFGHGVLKLDIESLSAPGEFHASATLLKLPGLGVIFGASSPIRFERKKHLIDSDDVALSLAVSGQSRFVMGSGEYTLSAGDATLTGAGEGGMNDSQGDCRYIVLRMPAKAVAPTRQPIGDLIGQRMSAEMPQLRLLRHYLGVLEDPATFATADTQRIVATHVHDLVTLTLGATRDALETARSRGGRAARLYAIKADIEQNLASADLSVAIVAVRHRLPVRYVQRLFEENGITFTAFVLDRRLARARQILVNPRFAHFKISMVATEAGFSNMAYFYETFRRRYGASPSDLRAQAQRPV